MKPILLATALLAIVLSGASAPTADSTTWRADSADAAFQVSESSWTGTIEQRDLGGKSTYVLVVGGQTYILTPQEKAAEFAGKTVTVTGTLQGNTVSIAEIEES